MKLQQQPTTILTWSLISCLGLGSATVVNAAGQDPLEPLPSFRDKSTLESFSLPSLDTEGLADAVIGGALDATAAGEETDAPVVLRERNNKSNDELLKEGFAKLPTPALDIPTPDLPRVVPPNSTVFDTLNITPR